MGLPAPHDEKSSDQDTQFQIQQIYILKVWQKGGVKPKPKVLSANEANDSP
jgi:hypothetical protein